MKNTLGCLRLAALLINGWPAFSQATTADIAGTVLDATGGSLAHAGIEARNRRTQIVSRAVTDAGGAFLLTALAPGDYTLTVELPGFKKAVREGIALDLGRRLELSIVLEVGGMDEEVTVTADPQLLRNTSAEVSDVIDNQRVVQLPLNGRQFLQLALLSDGVVKPPGGTRGAALQQAGELVNVAGQRGGHNIYLLDGVKVTDEYFNNLVVSPSVDGIQEFKIQKSMYAAEFGGKASALIQTASRSGTDRFHGALFEFLRNNVFDARNFFDRPGGPIPPLRQNQFGGALGGPLGAPRRRSPVFFFFNYEGQRIRRSQTEAFSVPEAAVRAGNLSGYAPVYDPLATDVVTGTRIPFAGNTIPSNRLDPVAVALAAKAPPPTQPGRVPNLVAAARGATAMNQYLSRVDYQRSERDVWFARFIRYAVGEFQPFGSSQLNETLLPGFGREVTTHTNNLAVSGTHVFNGDTLNEFRFGWLNISGGQMSENRGSDFAVRTGLQGVTTNPQDTGYPQASFGGLYSTLGDPLTFVTRQDRSIEIYDNVLFRRGRHSLKAGGYFFRLWFRPSNPEAARGAFEFTNRWTSSRPGVTDGNAFADFLLGYPSSAQVGIGRGDEDGRTNWLHGYMQDDWKVSRSLFLNIGLRYELNQHMTAADNRLSAIDLSPQGTRFVIASDGDGRLSSAATALLPLLPVTYASSADAGWTRSLLRPSYRRITPRIGLAWTVPGDSQMVIRAGFGLFANQWAYSVQQAFARNLPFFLNKRVDTPADASWPELSSRTILAAPPSGNIGGSNMDHDFHIEYNEAWTLAIQKLLNRQTSVEVSYLGSRTVGADSSIPRNVPLPGPGPIQPRRPSPELSVFNSIRWNGWSTYHALTWKLQRRLARGVSVEASYSWSKSIDDASDPGATTFESNFPQDVRNLRAEKARSSFDHTHRFVASYLSAIPTPGLPAGWLRAVLGGWQTGGIVILESGAPFTVNLGVDRANTGSGPAQRPDLLRDPNERALRTPDQWFDTGAFLLQAPFTFGNAGRNIVTAAGLRSVDASLQRDFRIRERAGLQLRWEVFNTVNHPQFDAPNRTAFTPNFGRVFRTVAASRQMQLGVRLTF